MKILDKISKFITGDPLKKYEPVVEEINERESELEDLSTEELKNRSEELKKKVREEGEDIDNIIPEAFALVREVSKRTLGQRHYDVQLLCGLTLHEGRIAEMLTGEGKTLAATLPLYLNSLEGKGAHLVTVNDYLAKRDTAWMGQIYEGLEMSVSCLVHGGAYMYDPDYVPEDTRDELDEQRDELGSFKVVEKFLRPISRKEAYEADITYGTNHHFGFDYLRDNMKPSLDQRVQRDFNYTIIDEVDSILIDEARTPLIISQPDEESSQYYKDFARIAKSLKRKDDYLVDEKKKSVDLTDQGIEKVERMADVDNIYAPENNKMVHYLNESLKAKALYRKDKEYVVKDNEIVLVDEFTGRLMPGRRLSGGLHQAIEAKESVPVQQENRTFAKITIQNFFRMYDKLSGMTGTAQSSAEEFDEVYDLEVVSIPPNEPVIRDDMSDIVFKTKEEKYRAVARDVKKRQKKGQPVLLGTTSIENNEVMSKYLKKAGIDHKVLNAKNNEEEGEVIAQAGKPGAVTVATNMAGRGVDIVLGGNPPSEEEREKILKAGGLHVIGTERHESRRVDNQLRGRAGRQGDPGSSQFFLSLEDDLLRIFGGDRMQNMMNSLNVPDDTPIESKMISKVVNQAQSKVEGMNLDMRKHLLEFDDVLNKQREAIYDRRVKILKAGDSNEILSIVRDVISDYIEGTRESLLDEIDMMRQNREDEKEVKKREKLLDELDGIMDDIPEEIDNKKSKYIARHMTQILNMLWVDNLDSLQALRESVGIRAYGKKEPIVEYRREAHFLYKELKKKFRNIVFKTVMPILKKDSSKLATKTQAKQKKAKAPDNRDIGRNDPCWCGSGKKYKYCHGG